MKHLVLIIFLLGCTHGLIAQDHLQGRDYRLLVPEVPELEYRLFDSIPDVSFPKKDGLLFNDSLKRLSLRRYSTSKSDFQLLARDPMPVVIPSAGFHSSMPVAVPDSSVHYHILNKRMNLQMHPRDHYR